MEKSKKIKGRVAKVKEEAGVIPDIEDAANMVSPYFSPLQTRQQRKNNSNQIPKTELKLVSPVKETAKKTKIEKKIDPLSLVEKEEWMPDNWEQVLENIRIMRKGPSAPVDTMGCHKCSDSEADEKTQRFQKLVALMLSSQTKDETTFAAMQRLKDNNLNPESIAAMNTTDLEKILHPVSFYKNKAKYLKQTATILIDQYDSDIPNTIKELVALPGVGPKMAHICMSTAWNEVTGIGVDVHVHRIANRLNWMEENTKEPEETRIALEKWLPKDLWAEVNSLLVGFGQTVCTPLRPHCATCLNKDICPSAELSPKKSAITEHEESKILPIKKAKFQKKKLGKQ